MAKLNGRVDWFDASSGEGMVLLEDGRYIYCHFTALVGVSSSSASGYAYPSPLDQVYLSVIGGKECQVELYTNLYTSMCERVWITE